MDTPTTTSAPAPVFEIWRNTGNGLVVLTKLNPDGSERQEPLKGQHEIRVTADDRRTHSSHCVRRLDPFKNGLLEPMNDAAIEASREQSGQADTASPWSSSGVGTTARPTPATGTVVPQSALPETELEQRVGRLEGGLSEILALLRGETPTPAADEKAAGPGPDPTYQIFDEATGQMVEASAGIQVPQRSYAGKLTDAERATVIGGDRPSAVAILERIDSAVVVEQLRDAARKDNASAARIELISQRLMALDPTARPVRTVNRVTRTGADEAGPQVVDLDHLGDPTPQGLAGGAEMSDQDPQNVVVPGEGIRDETDTTRFVPEYDPSFPPPIMPPGVMDVD